MNDTLMTAVGSILALLIGLILLAVNLAVYGSLALIAYLLLRGPLGLG